MNDDWTMCSVILGRQTEGNMHIHCHNGTVHFDISFLYCISSQHFEEVIATW